MKSTLPDLILRTPNCKHNEVHLARSDTLCPKFQSVCRLRGIISPSPCYMPSYIVSISNIVSWGPDPLSGTVVGQTGFDVTIRQSVVADRNLLCAILISHKTVSDVEVKVCLLPWQLCFESGQTQPAGNTIRQITGSGQI